MDLGLNIDLIQFLFVMTRVAALVAVAPIFGPAEYPKSIKALFALYLSIAIWNVAPPRAFVGEDLVGLTLHIGGEALLGITMGFTVQLIFSVVSISGQMMSISGGMAMANVLDPLSAGQVTVLTRFKNMLIFLLFFMMDLHHTLIRGLRWSFTAIPPGGAGQGGAVGMLIVDQFGGVMAAGLQIALPSVVLVLLIQAGMALLARMAPQMNVFFAVGHMATLSLTLGMLYLSLSLITGIFEDLTADMADQLVRIVRFFAL